MDKARIGRLRTQAAWLKGAAAGSGWSLIVVCVLATAMSLLGVWEALLLKNLIDVATSGGEGLWPAALAFVLVTVAQIALGSLREVAEARTRVRQLAALQGRLFRKLLAADYMTLSEKHSGDYVNRLMGDTEVVNSFLLSLLPGILSTGAQLVAASYALLVLEPWLALAVLVAAPLFIVLMKLFAAPMKRTAAQLQGLRGESMALTQESIQNVTTLRAFQRQRETLHRLMGLQRETLTVTDRRAKLSAAAGAIQMIGWNATYLASLLWGVVRLRQGTVGYGSLAAYLQLVSQIQAPLHYLAGQLPAAFAASASVQRLMEISLLPEEDLDGDIPIMGPLAVRLAGVRFSYKPGETVLSGADMEFPSGIITAVMGPTGEGKSTIARLLLGLTAPQSGQILLEGADGSTLLVSAATRSAFSYVQQGNFLLSGTIEENLRLGREKASPGEMEAALRLACAWDFVSSLPQGLQTRVGEQGAGLSEGQRQRLAIARALLRDAPILILDEATSALDKKTEAQLWTNLREALMGRTVVVITHRSAVLKLCGRVYALSGGTARLVKGNLRPAVGRFFRRDAAAQTGT